MFEMPKCSFRQRNELHFIEPFEKLKGGFGKLAKSKR